MHVLVRARTRLGPGGCDRHGAQHHGRSAHCPEDLGRVGSWLADQLQYEHDPDVAYAIFVGRVRAAARQGLGIARDEQEVAVNLAPESPLLLADRFHPHVWSSAAPLWPTGQYRVAVANAAASLSAHIAEKSGITNLADRGVVQQVFASKSAPGQARLHLRGDVASDTWRSRQEGLHLIAQGAFAGIRAHQ